MEIIIILAITVLVIVWTLLGGLFYALLARRLTKGKEPWFTLIMVCGLALTLLVGRCFMPLSDTICLVIFLVSALLFISLRKVFGQNSSIEMFILSHMIVTLCLFLLPALDKAKHRAEEAKNARQAAESQSSAPAPTGIPEQR